MCAVAVACVMRYLCVALEKVDVAVDCLNKCFGDGVRTLFTFFRFMAITVCPGTSQIQMCMPEGGSMETCCLSVIARTTPG